MDSKFNELSKIELSSIEGGSVLGVLMAAGYFVGSAVVVGGVTYSLKKGLEYLGSLF
ncbi:hypothetical protein [Amphibacillus xylanus]|uniref:Bacteriocin n=1 Tax=Amphibacillus xylanus (strain ATCC 51415 / DSM 6626 / JCM 7361 / LMG 17667 / NBRC 15112 / Ep01) TaxID=698758 RepID=K0J131_AMPXN|nr:hypothetical protein [Amphibacillus xylanus]BAM46847.1 hypothetical protein AXY_07150 [Amphibacillus xylanus NBRC 15112]